MDRKKLLFSAFGISDKPEMQKEQDPDYFEMESENIAKDIIRAIDKKDALALKIALKSFITYCELKEDLTEME